MARMECFPRFLNWADALQFGTWTLRDKVVRTVFPSLRGTVTVGPRLPILWSQIRAAAGEIHTYMHIYLDKYTPQYS